MRIGNYFHSRPCSSLVLLAFVLSQLGCAADRRAAEPQTSRSLSQARADSETAAPVAEPDARGLLLRVLSEIDRRTLSFETVSARFDVTLTQADGSTVRVDGQYMGDNSGNVRLRLAAVFNTLVLDLAVANGRMTCWMPLRKVALTGERTQIISDGSPILALLMTISQAGELFFPRPWDSRAAGRRAFNRQQETFVDVYGGAEGKTGLRRCVLNVSEGQMLRQDFSRQDGSALGSIAYAQFGPGEPARTHVVPRQIRLSNAAGSFGLALNLKSLSVNQGLPKQAFALDMPAKQLVQETNSLADADQVLFGK